MYPIAASFLLRYSMYDVNRLIPSSVIVFSLMIFFKKSNFTSNSQKLKTSFFTCAHPDGRTIQITAYVTESTVEVSITNLA